LVNLSTVNKLLPRDRANRFFQSAWVVNDLRQAARRWVETFGVGPFYIFEGLVLEDLKYRGAPATMDFSAALAQAGDQQIELIRQGCDQPSAYRDLYPINKEGFHHLAVFAEDYGRELEFYREQGFQIATEGRLGTVRYCYVDTTGVAGFMIEVIEENVPYRQLFAEVAAAARNWDGERPIRSHHELGQLTESAR
jgi:hypothetical protein